MNVIARKYNPGFLTDEELVATFRVRTCEFDSLMEPIRECSGNSNIHQLVIGPRGSGKTTLLLRIAAEIRRDPDLASRFFPVVFAEESYEVSSTGEFWLACLSYLAAQAPPSEDGLDLHRTFEELRQIRDDRTLADRCLGAIQDFADHEGKRLVPIVENLNTMFQDIADKEAGWRLRHTLQTEPRIYLLASATSRFQEIDDPKRALYDQFRVIKLDPLTADQCSVLWETVSGMARPPNTIRALRILTGGSPRLVTILARFGGNLSFRKLMSDLLDLVDDHTEYFKSHLNALPHQERRVYLALADLWKPATTREIADRARLDTSKCSAQLARLTARGVVEVIGGSPRRKLYYLAERLYNIYYLMRRARGPVPLIEALIRFMETYYSPDELREFGVRIAFEAKNLDDNAQSDYRAAFARLIELPSLAAHREELRLDAPWMVSDGPGDHRSEQPWPEAVKALFNQAFALMEQGLTLQALASWDEVVSRFDEDGEEPCPGAVARALVSKALILGDMGRPDESLSICEQMLARFGAAGGPTVLPEVAGAMVCKGIALGDFGRHQEAVATYDEILYRFGHSESPEVLRQVATALLNKGVLLAESNRQLEALAAWDKLLESYWASDSQTMREYIASCLLCKGETLVKLNRPEEAYEVWNEVVHRFAASSFEKLRYAAAQALFNKAALDLAGGRADASIATVDRAMELNFVELRFSPWRGHLIRARAYLAKGNTAACTRDIDEVLAILPVIRGFPKEALDRLCELATDFGFEPMRDLIRASSAEHLLLPLTIALEKEMGLEPRVAKEVEEVAEDVRQELKPRTTQDSGAVAFQLYHVSADPP